MLAQLNLKRQNFLRLNFKFHGANPFVKTSAAEAAKAAARETDFKISLCQDRILRAKIKRQGRSYFTARAGVFSRIFKAS